MKTGNRVLAENLLFASPVKVVTATSARELGTTADARHGLPERFSAAYILVEGPKEALGEVAKRLKAQFEQNPSMNGAACVCPVNEGNGLMLLVPVEVSDDARWVDRGAERKEAIRRMVEVFAPQEYEDVYIMAMGLGEQYANFAEADRCIRTAQENMVKLLQNVVFPGAMIVKGNSTTPITPSLS